MPDCIVCNVCDRPGAKESSPETARIPSNVRKFQNEEFTVWRCANCRSLHSLEDVDLDHYYEDYIMAGAKLNFHSRLGCANRLRMLLKHGVTRQAKILDYGCGSGVFLQYLEQRGYTQGSGYDVYIPRFSDPGVMEQTYDAIVSFDVIEHVAEPREFMATLAARLNPGGLLVVGTPNAEKLSLAKRMTVELHQPFHRHILSERALVALGEREGLASLEVRRRNWLDTLVPTVNSRFVWEYIYKSGGIVDVMLDPPRVGMVLASPRLCFFSWAGYFFPDPGSMFVIFRR